ncbi:hypothetical protein KCG44_01445 [Pacificimonas sp. WHA3]|uniref:Uncharacterized protein n=1 Tax=Pacificimonas pallii TaxID=2827236 RepID=A0ABS6SAM2_9SPHN|nr:hypothetical protein [Pacificimonas pallii]MBV7255442.1 hypothetical protein [Pacificimonas pallii]
MFTSIRLGIIAALLASSYATAADAHRRHHRHNHDRFDVGDAIIGAVVLGAVVGILNGSKNRNRDERRGEPLPPAPYPDDRYPGDAYPGDRVDDRDAGWNDDGEWSRADPEYASRFPSERAAINACAREAEALGRRYGADARVSYIGGVSPEGSEYRVTGRMETDIASEERVPFDSFTCFADGSRITGFRYS